MTLCVGLQAIWMLTLEPECLKPIDHHATKIISDGTGLFTETLKLLAVSLCRRRSSLLSSTQLM